MQDYYDELWERLDEQLTPPGRELREALLLDEVRAGERALDLGCGAGAYTETLARAGARAVGVDVARAALRRAQMAHPGLDFRLAAIDRPLPLADNAFELVWASEVIEHVADTARWLSEVRRVLAPGGRLLLTSPSHGRLPVAVWGIERYSPPLGDHLHLYTRRSLREVLGDLGFGEVHVCAIEGPPLLRRTLLARAVR